MAPLECEAILYYRPVNDPRAQKFNATHSYWEVLEYNPNTGTTLNEMISGGPVPSKQGTLKHGPGTYLDVWVHSPQDGVDSPQNGTAWFNSGWSASNCAGVEAMLAAANAWPYDEVPYNALFGPNSNTVAQEIGAAGGFKPSQPPGAWGW